MQRLRSWFFWFFFCDGYFFGFGFIFASRLFHIAVNLSSSSTEYFFFVLCSILNALYSINACAYMQDPRHVCSLSLTITAHAALGCNENGDKKKYIPHPLTSKTTPSADGRLPTQIAPLAPLLNPPKCRLKAAIHPPSRGRKHTICGGTEYVIPNRRKSSWGVFV